MAKLAPADTTSGFALAAASFAISIFLWSAFIGGWLPDPQAAGLALFVTGGIGMLIAGIIAYREGAAFGTAFNIVMSTFWFGSGIFLWFLFPSGKNLAVDTAWIAFAFGIFIGIGTWASLRMKAPLLTLSGALLFLVFVLLWVFSAFHTGLATLKIAGVLGIAAAACQAIIFAQRMWQEAA